VVFGGVWEEGERGEGRGVRGDGRSEVDEDGADAWRGRWGVEGAGGWKGECGLAG